MGEEIREHIRTSTKFRPISLKKLKINPGNIKSHSKEQIEFIKKSILKYGFRDPIEVDQNNMIISGEGRYLAAKELKMSEVNCIIHEDFDEKEKEGYLVTTNKSQELYAKDKQNSREILEEFDFEVEELKDMGIEDISFDYEETQEKEVDPELQSIVADEVVKRLGQHLMHCPQCGCSFTRDKQKN